MAVKITISNKNGTVLNTEKKYVEDNIQIALDDTSNNNLVADNIAEGKIILGVTGTLKEGINTNDATATASDIIIGKTAYVKGNKIEGTMRKYANSFSGNGEIVQGYNVTFTIQGHNSMGRGDNVVFYSLDNGSSWVNLYTLNIDFLLDPTTISIPNVSQIKFKTVVSGMYFATVTSTTLSLNLNGSTSGEYISENYILTNNVDDLIVNNYMRRV